MDVVGIYWYIFRASGFPETTVNRWRSSGLGRKYSEKKDEYAICGGNGAVGSFIAISQSPENEWSMTRTETNVDRVRSKWN